MVSTLICLGLPGVNPVQAATNLQQKPFFSKASNADLDPRLYYKLAHTYGAGLNSSAPTPAGTTESVKSGGASTEGVSSPGSAKTEGVTTGSAQTEALSGFVSTNGTNFILNGQIWYPAGSNDYFLVFR